MAKPDNDSIVTRLDGIIKLHAKIKNGQPKGQIRIEGFGLRG